MRRADGLVASFPLNGLDDFLGVLQLLLVLLTCSCVGEVGSQRFYRDEEILRLVRAVSGSSDSVVEWGTDQA